MVTLPALLPPGVPLDDFGVLSFLDELDFDLDRAEGDGDEVREEGDDLRDDDGVEDRSAASSTYLGFWIDFLRALLEEVSSSSSTNLGGAFFFLVERLDIMRLVLVRKATSVGLCPTTNCE
jgi:hypothetical protein